jgi:hypothetical protein
MESRVCVTMGRRQTWCALFAARSWFDGGK